MLLAAGLLVRVVCLPLAGTEDVMVWKTWSYGAATDISSMYGVGGTPPTRGIVSWHSRQTTVDYPPGTLYGLAIVGRVYRAFDPTFTGSEDPAYNSGDRWRSIFRLKPEATRLRRVDRPGGFGAAGSGLQATCENTYLYDRANLAGSG